MMKNCVFRAYVTNLGLYNEGYLVGEWVSFPLEREGMTFDESINDMLKRIKVDGKVYEEYFITDYESNVTGLTESFGEYEYAEESGMFTEEFETLGVLRNYIDYESYGRDIRLEEGGIHTDHGYISLTDSIKEYIEEIPA